ncbi:MAG: MoaD/ThiS family protein [Gudongella sp.]|nr:MoaD/ThiS family protein [Gudongella sp.]
MIIKISRVFLQEGDSNNLLQIKLAEPTKIDEILKEIKLEGMGYAEFYLNNKKVNKNTIARNEDELLIIPIFGGG